VNADGGLERREPADAALPRPEDVTAFWRAAGRRKWFRKDAAFDREITARFLPAHEAAAAGCLSEWEATPQGALALLLLLDQFPRNMFRGSARAFATDPLARAVAECAIAQGFDASVASAERAFFYLPFMHSENPADQERSVALWRHAGDGKNRKYAELHAGIIRHFGRFPHRNAVLGRATTPEEQAFLDAGGFAG
jgi:uncharacterized protein (DUF924 family)